MKPLGLLPPFGLGLGLEPLQFHPLSLFTFFGFCSDPCSLSGPDAGSFSLGSFNPLALRPVLLLLLSFLCLLRLFLRPPSIQQANQRPANPPRSPGNAAPSTGRRHSPLPRRLGPLPRCLGLGGRRLPLGPGSGQQSVVQGRALTQRGRCRSGRHRGLVVGIVVVGSGKQGDITGVGHGIGVFGISVGVHRGLESCQRGQWGQRGQDGLGQTRRGEGNGGDGAIFVGGRRI